MSLTRHTCNSTVLADVDTIIEKKKVLSYQQQAEC
jgi:hypothetical protein